MSADVQKPTLGARFEALTYDAFVALGERRGMAARRREVLSRARGRVLEIGAGTGLNLAHYPATVDELVLTEPEAAMVARLERRLGRSSRRARLVRTGAEALPFADGAFDTVVSTMVLCTVPEPAAAIAEIRRVLAPGGRLLFIEHVRDASEGAARWQDRLAGPWAGFAQGCRCNQPTLELLSAGGLRADAPVAARWRGMPRIVAPLLHGEATAAV